MSTPSTSSQIRERKQFQGVMTPARDAVLGKNESVPVQNQTDGWQKKQVSHVRRRQRVRITAYRWMLGGGGGGAAGGNVWKASSSIEAAEWWRLKSFGFSSAVFCVLIISLYHMSYKASWCNVTTASLKYFCCFIPFLMINFVRPRKFSIKIHVYSWGAEEAFWATPTT